MEVGQRSRTIDRPAVMRAAHQLLDDEPKVFRDPVAVGLTPESSEAVIRASAAELRSDQHKRLRSVAVLRARFAEDCLAEAVREGVAQYVVLGAGLDTFAFRGGALARRLRLFEVDHPDTQEWKRRCVAQAGLVEPANLAYVTLDLETEPLRASLCPAGFDPARPAFFSWLGVTQYLTVAATEATLGFIARLPSASGVVLSFVPPDDELADVDLAEVRASTRRAASLGEPWLTRYRSSELVQRLRRLGFRSVLHLTPGTASQRYFAGRADGLRAPRFEQLMLAVV